MEYILPIKREHFSIFILRKNKNNLPKWWSVNSFEIKLNKNNYEELIKLAGMVTVLLSVKKVRYFIN